MQFRVRPSSRKSSQNEGSLVEFPTHKHVPEGIPRSVQARIDQLESALSGFQEVYRREREISNAGYVEIQKRLDRVEYKTFAAEQDLRQLSEIREIKPAREPVLGAHTDTSKNDLMMLRQMLLQEKEATKETVKHQNAVIEQLSLKQLRTEQELREALSHQRRDYETRLNGHGDELREIESLKQRKMDQQYEMIKGVVANAERKIYDELERKIRNETVVRDFVEDRLAQVQEEMAAQQRQTMAIEAKFVRETKQSLENLFAMVSGVRKELGDELSETQKLAVNSIKKLSMTMEVNKEKSAEEVRQLTASTEDHSNEISELRGFVSDKLEETRQLMSEFEEQTLERLEGNNSSGVETGRIITTGGDTERYGHIQKELNQWKSLTEQKNLNVFKEISNALKTMKQEWRKENDDLVGEISSLGDTLRELKKSQPSELKKSVQAIVAIFNNEFDVLAEELEALTDMIALAKRENEKALKEGLARQRESLLEEVKVMVNSKGKELTLYTDKGVNRSEETLRTAISKEGSYVTEKLGQRMEKTESSLSSLEGVVKKSGLMQNAQLEEYSVRLKKFNDNYKDYLEEQRKEDMRKRNELEEAMRKNANNLMDIYYKKSEFLVDGLKSNIEMAQMKQQLENSQALETTRDQLKKDMLQGKQEWQKELGDRAEQLTKERESSEEVLHEAMEQSINNAKRNLSNEVGNAKLELEEKLNEQQQKELQRQEETDNAMLELKNTLFDMLRDEKKLTEEAIQVNRKEVEDKVDKVELQVKELTESAQKQAEEQLQAAVTKQEEARKQEMEQLKGEMEKDKVQTQKSTEELIAAAIAKEEKERKDQVMLLRADLDKEKEETKKNTEETVAAAVAKEEKERKEEVELLRGEISKEGSSNKKDNEELVKAEVAKQDQARKEEIAQLKEDIAKENTDKIILIEKRLNDADKAKVKEEQQRGEKIAAIEGRLDKIDANEKSKEGEGVVKGQQLDKRIAAVEEHNKQSQLETQEMYKQYDAKLEDINKKLSEGEKSSKEKEGESAKVGEEKLKKLREDMERDVKSLKKDVSELEDKLQEEHKDYEDTEEAVGNLKKSVNKLEAMVFSEQAKSKAMFDRLTEDVDKLGENMAILTNELR